MRPVSYLHLPRQVEQRTFFGEEPAVDPEGSIDAITSLQALTNPHTPFTILCVWKAMAYLV